MKSVKKEHEPDLTSTAKKNRFLAIFVCLQQNSEKGPSEMYSTLLLEIRVLKYIMSHSLSMHHSFISNLLQTIGNEKVGLHFQSK